MQDKRKHWEQIYSTKAPHEVSWTQAVPQTSLAFIHSVSLDRDAPVIDIGGGDSRLVDFLLDEGFTDVSVLDISSHAVERAQKRLGQRAGKVNWIVSDINDFKPGRTYAFWHDRAAFHFLTTEEQVASYVSTAGEAVGVNGFATIGTFSEDGPARCSGLPIKQYSQENLVATMGTHFEKIRCTSEDHGTPFGTVQNFTFCIFRRGKSGILG